MSGKRYYEAHVTMLGMPGEGRTLVERIRWKYSCIDGDANLGDGVKCYATRQFKGTLTEQQVVGLLNDAANLLAEHGHKVIRRKVEVVIFDDRSEAVQPCDGACPECHTDDLLEVA